MKFPLRFALGLIALTGTLHAAALSIPYPVMDPGTVGTAYAKSIAATGGTPPYVFSVSAGTPVPGLALTTHKSNAQFSGTPVTAGDYTFTLTVIDAAGATVSVAEDVYIGGAAGAAASSSSSNSGSNSGSTANSGGATATGALTIQYPELNGGTLGTPYSDTLVASGGTPPYAWSITSGPLPPGVQLAGGVFSGTPTTYGEYKFTVNVTDAAGAVFSANEDIWMGNPSGSSAGSPAAPPPPSTYTLTVVNGTINGGPGATGSFAPGATVTIAANPAPAGEYFQQWSGGTVASAGTPATTLAMPSADLTLTANYFVAAPIPQPVAAHPRLWITPADLPRLQSWAVPTNPVYAHGLALVLQRALGDYADSFFPGGTVNPVYPDLGDTQGYQGLLTEQDSLVLALASLVDPSPANRITYAQDARNLIMVAMNQAALGHATGLPFRDPLFATYNRANFTSEAWPLTVDWIYNATDANGQAILTAADKATIRQVFLMWANDCLNAETTGGDHPGPLGLANSPALTPGGNAYRMAANNYYLGHARLLTLMALSLDPVDDPALNPQLPDSALGNTLRSYIADATGAWLYQEFAMFGDPAAVRAAYNLPAASSVGLASGGLPPEGMLYGHSLGFLLGQLLALQTAGYNTPALSGPQAALIGAPVWDRFVQGFISSLVPAAQVYPGWNYMGPVFEMASYGDLIRLWMTPDAGRPFALLNAIDHQMGNHARDNAVDWFLVNADEGGAGFFNQRLTSSWEYGVQDTILPFLVMDPAAPAATDPRPAWPTQFYDAPAGRLVAHSDWTPNATMFDYRGSWISINHQDADGGLFEFYRKGEWLTKETSNYDGVGNGQSSLWHNTLALQNWSPAAVPALNWFEVPLWQNGSQWQLGAAAGDPTTVTSQGTGYTFVQSDLTNLFNRPSGWSPPNALLDILGASRSILWIGSDFIVVYDRATSLHAGLFKQFNLSLVAAPSITGSLVTEVTPGGQSLFVQSLLPANGTITWTPLQAPTAAVPSGPDTLTLVSELEPTIGRIVVQDPSNPSDTRFLHVLQGADAGVAAAPALLIQNSSGAAYQGAVFGASAALFPVVLGEAVTSLSYTVPASVAHHYVTGLTPLSGYTVTETPAGANLQVEVQAGGSSLADAAGVLSF